MRACLCKGHPLLPPSSLSSAAWLSGLDPTSTSGFGAIVLVASSASCDVDVATAEKAVTQVRSSRDGSPVCRGYRMERLESPSRPHAATPAATTTAAATAAISDLTLDSTAENSANMHTFDATTSHPCFFGYRRDHQHTVARLLYDSRSFQIDSTPKLLLSAGKMVDSIISSGVGHYLEFKSVESLFYVAAKATNKSASKVVSKEVHEKNEEDLATSAALLKLWRVPCCKKDIFNTKLFTALEKRSLMKLMQFAVDHGRAKDGLPVTTLNESELAQGRSLFRPQNKLAPPAGGGSAAKETAEKEEEENEKTFFEFLNESTVPARLQVHFCARFVLIFHNTPNDS